MTRPSLKERLRQFDPAPRPARTLNASTELANVMARGARWAGRPGRSHLRIDRALPEPFASRLDVAGWHALLGQERPPRPWVVLDTETTGLESGVGILVFVIGLIIWDDDQSRLVQLLLPEPEVEAGFLADLVQEIEAAGAFLSYNGKTFDVPRLISRLRLHRHDPTELFDKPHLDLLHPTRRIMREWIGDARLASVEEFLLDIHRVQDLSGWEVPEAYRDFLTSGDDTDLARVLDHNQQDILSLVELAPVLADCFTGGRRAQQLPPEAQLGLGRALFATGNLVPAATCLAWASQSELTPIRRKARWLRFLTWRRQREFDRMHEELREMVEEWPRWVAARIELAKVLEHRRRDVGAAREEVLVALDLVAKEEALVGGSRARRRDELLHRLRRLERKAASG